MADQLYQGRHAWVLTPDALLSEVIKEVASEIPEKRALLANPHPCLYLAGGEMKILKSQIQEFRQALLDLKDEVFVCNLDSLEIQDQYLIWRPQVLPENISRLIISCQVYLNPFLGNIHLQSLAGKVAVSRILPDRLPRAEPVSFFAEHLDFVELDDNFFTKKPLFRVF